MREFRHKGVNYSVTVYSSADASKFSLEEVALEDQRPKKFREGARYQTLEAAFEAGQAMARALITT